MKKLLNTLYVTSENSYLGLVGENVVVYDDKNGINTTIKDGVTLGDPVGT